MDEPHGIDMATVTRTPVSGSPWTARAAGAFVASAGVTRTGFLICLVLLGGLLPATPQADAQQLTVEQFVGTTGGPGTDDGVGSAARFYNPWGIAIDPAGDLYVADSNNNSIRKVTPAGVVTHLAGSSEGGSGFEGPGGLLGLVTTFGVVADRDGNVYFTFQNAISRCTPEGVVSTFAGSVTSWGSADGVGTAARFYGPRGLAVDPAGCLYVADAYNHTIRKITPDGVVTTLAGLAGVWGSDDGSGSAARFDNPLGVAVDAAGVVYVADSDNHTIRMITPDGVVTTLAGLAGSSGFTNGVGSVARFYYPKDVAVDSGGNLFVSMYNRIRKIVVATAEVTTFAGGSTGFADGAGTSARFDDPHGLIVSPTDDIYVVDRNNQTIRKVTSGAVVTTIAGEAAIKGTVDGTGGAARLNRPYDVVVDSSGNCFVLDSSNYTIRKVTPAGVVTTLAGEAGSYGTDDGTGSAARFYSLRGAAIDSSGNLYVTDRYRVRKVTPAGVVTSLAGSATASGSADGVGTAARFYIPRGICVDSSGDLFVSDSYNHTIRKVTETSPDTWEVTTIAGSAGSSGSTDGLGSTARFYYPHGIVVDGSGVLYVADNFSHTIRKITPPGTDWDVSTFAGQAGSQGGTDGVGSAARFTSPSGLTLDSSGDLWAVDRYKLRKIVTATATVSSPAGDWLGGQLSREGSGAFARLYYAQGLAITSSGTVYVADYYFHKILRAEPRLDDSATIDAGNGDLGVQRQLDTSPQSATSWQWSISHRPANSSATLSSTSIRNPTFTPDVVDRFEFLLEASDGTSTSSTRVLLDICSPTATVSGSELICEGAAATIEAVLSGTAPWNLVWSDSYVQNGVGSSPAERSVSPSTTTTYSVTSVSATACGTGTASGSVTVTVEPTGAPLFAGVAAVFQEPAVGLRLDWEEPTQTCGGSAGPPVFNVYRSLTSGFTPGAGTLHASCVTDTRYMDTAVTPGTTYYYVVRAEAPGSSGSGPCNHGIEDVNTVERWGVAPAGSGSAPDGVGFLTVTSTDSSNTVEWVNPSSGYGTTRICWRQDAEPSGPSDSLATCFDQTGDPGQPDSYPHTGLTNGQWYHYAAWVSSSGDYSAGRFTAGRPFSAPTQARWAYSTGATNMAPPGIGSVFATSNDRGLHSALQGASGGTWPASWIPFRMNAPAQARPPVIALELIAGVGKQVYLGSQDGNVYAVNALTGAELWSTEDANPGPLGGIVQAGVAAMFDDWGAARDLLFVGTRDSGEDNSFFALDPTDGAIVWEFTNSTVPADGDNGDGTGGIGIVSGHASVSYEDDAVYFTSRERAAGSSTVWCLDAATGERRWSAAVGSIDGGPILRGTRLYVGTNAGEVWALDATPLVGRDTGDSLWSAPFTTGDGPVKGFVWADPSSSRMYFSTTTKVWGLDDLGGTSDELFSTAISSPSTPLLAWGAGDTYLYVGGANGALHQLDLANPEAPVTTSITLGDGSAALGSPSLDVSSDPALLLVGSEDGILYAVEVPL